MIWAAFSHHSNAEELRRFQAYRPLETPIPSDKQLLLTEITTTELVKLAEAIAKAVPPVPVPAGVFLIIKDVIAKRERSAQWYSAQALKEDSNIAVENESHRYFILVS